MAKLTKRAIRKLEAPPKSRGSVDVPDQLIKGLYLSVQPSGVKSWIVRYRYRGRSRKLTLKRDGAIDVTAARQLARDVLVSVAAGRDPQGEKVEARRQAAEDNFRALAIRFIEEYSRPKNRSWLAQARFLGLRAPKVIDSAPVNWQIIAGSCVDQWKSRAVASIEKREIAKAVSETTVSSGPAAATQLLAHLRRAFNWFVEQGFIAASPAQGTKPPPKAEARERVLTDNELRLIWRASDKIAPAYGDFVKLLMITGQRRNEVAEAEAKELDGLVWTIPAARTKNKLEHALPLPKQALQVFVRRPTEGAGYLFSVTKGNTPLSAFSKIKDDLDAAATKLNGGAPLDGWRLHDLRRTCASGMARLKVEPHVIEAVINHKSGVISGVAALYNRHTYEAEMRTALERWAQHIEKLAY